VRGSAFFLRRTRYSSVSPCSLHVRRLHGDGTFSRHDVTAPRYREDGGVERQVHRESHVEALHGGRDAEMNGRMTREIPAALFSSCRLASSPCSSCAMYSDTTRTRWPTCSTRQSNR